MKITCLLAIALFAQGCAPVTEQKLERRQYLRTDRVNKYLEFRQNCKLAGGRVHIRRWGSGSPRNRMPNPGDIYTCVGPSRQRGHAVY